MVKYEKINKVVQSMFNVANSPFMFCPGVDGGELKSMRLAGRMSLGPLKVDGPGALLRPVVVG